MATFTIQAPDGRKIKIEAADEATALRGAKEWAEANPIQPAPAPADLQPGTREYADWARGEAMAGRELPQVSDAPPEFKDPNLTGPMGKFDAGYTSFVNGIPIAGPSLLSGVENLRAMAQGMPVEGVQAEGQAAREANPITSGVSGVAGAVLPMVPLGLTSLGGRLLGNTGNLASQMAFGGASGALIGGADTAARGGDMKDAVTSGALGLGLGLGLPVVARGIGAGWNALTGKTVSKEARNVARALGDDGITPAALPQMLDDLGPDGMVMDLGPNLQAQAGALASVPGSAQKTLRGAVAARSSGAGARVADDVAQTVGNSPDLFTLTNKIIADQSAAATPLYDAIRDVPVPAQGGDFFFIFQTPMGKAALQRGKEMAANDGVQFQATGLTAGMVDYAKRALDDIAGEAARGGKNNLARQASSLARRLAAATDDVVPGYKAAREAFAGPAQVLEAIQSGTEALGKDISPSQMRSMLNAMTASERDAFLQGFQSSIEANMGNAVNDVAALRNMFRKSNNEAKLRILLGDDVADDLLKRIDRELTFGQTTNAVASNSETARRAAAQGEINPGSRDVNPEGVTGLIFRAINGARAALRGKVQPQVNARMASFLQSGGGNLDADMLRQIQTAARGPRPLPLPPASGGLAIEAMAGKKRPVEITVRGGAR